MARSATADNTFAEPDVKGNERATRNKEDVCLTLFETNYINRYNHEKTFLSGVLFNVLPAFVCIGSKR